MRLPKINNPVLRTLAGALVLAAFLAGIAGISILKLGLLGFGLLFFVVLAYFVGNVFFG